MDRTHPLKNVIDIEIRHDYDRVLLDSIPMRDVTKIGAISQFYTLLCIHTVTSGLECEMQSEANEMQSNDASIPSTCVSPEKHYAITPTILSFPQCNRL